MISACRVAVGAARLGGDQPDDLRTVPLHRYGEQQRQPRHPVDGHPEGSHRRRSERHATGDRLFPRARRLELLEARVPRLRLGHHLRLPASARPGALPRHRGAPRRRGLALARGPGGRPAAEALVGVGAGRRCVRRRCLQRSRSRPGLSVVGTSLGWLGRGFAAGSRRASRWRPGPAAEHGACWTSSRLAGSVDASTAARYRDVVAGANPLLETLARLPTTVGRLAISSSTCSADRPRVVSPGQSLSTGAFSASPRSAQTFGHHVGSGMIQWQVAPADLAAHRTASTEAYLRGLRSFGWNGDPRPTWRPPRRRPACKSQRSAAPRWRGSVTTGPSRMRLIVLGRTSSPPGGTRPWRMRCTPGRRTWSSPSRWRSTAWRSSTLAVDPGLLPVGPES